MIRVPSPERLGSSAVRDGFGAIAPPSTTIPSGGPRDESQRGKRFSSAWISDFPAGEKPAITNRMKLAPASQRPTRLKRVAISTRPIKTSVIRKFDGNNRKAAVFDDEEHQRVFFQSS